MDVHDTALIPLEPGMVITVDPGKLFMYICFFQIESMFIVTVNQKDGWHLPT